MAKLENRALGSRSCVDWQLKEEKAGVFVNFGNSALLVGRANIWAMIVISELLVTVLPTAQVCVVMIEVY